MIVKHVEVIICKYWMYEERELLTIFFVLLLIIVINGVCMKEAPNWVRNDVSYYLNYFHFFSSKEHKIKEYEEKVFIYAHRKALLFCTNFYFFYSLMVMCGRKKKLVTYIVNMLTNSRRRINHRRILGTKWK